MVLEGLQHPPIAGQQRNAQSLAGEKPLQQMLAGVQSGQQAGEFGRIADHLHAAAPLEPPEHVGPARLDHYQPAERGEHRHGALPGLRRPSLRHRNAQALRQFAGGKLVEQHIDGAIVGNRQPGLRAQPGALVLQRQQRGLVAGDRSGPGSCGARSPPPPPPRRAAPARPCRPRAGCNSRRNAGSARPPGARARRSPAGRRPPIARAPASSARDRPCDRAD